MRDLSNDLLDRTYVLYENQRIRVMFSQTSLLFLTINQKPWSLQSVDFYTTYICLDRHDSNLFFASRLWGWQLEWVQLVNKLWTWDMMKWPILMFDELWASTGAVIKFGFANATDASTDTDQTLLNYCHPRTCISYSIACTHAKACNMNKSTSILEQT